MLYDGQGSLLGFRPSVPLSELFVRTLGQCTTQETGQCLDVLWIREFRILDESGPRFLSSIRRRNEVSWLHKEVYRTWLGILLRKLHFQEGC